METDELAAYLDECCLKYDLDSCVLLNAQGRVVQSSGVFIPDACLSDVPAWIQLSQRMSALSGVKPLSYATLTGAGQRQHLLAWKLLSEGGEPVFVVLRLKTLPRHVLVMQQAISRDIPTLLRKEEGEV